MFEFDENAQSVDLKQIVPALRILKTVGVTKISFSYQGEGDSGDIDPACIEPSKLDLKRFLQEAINELLGFVEAMLPYGWEINDGSEGEFEFDLEKGEFVWTHRERETIFHEESSNYSIDL